MNGLLWVYLLGGALEVVGILYTAKIAMKVIRPGGWNPSIEFPDPWQVRLALGLVLAGVVVSVFGNVAALCVN